MARVYDALNDVDKGIQFYKNVLYYDSSNVEAIACLASYHFYTDQPEIALRCVGEGGRDNRGAFYRSGFCMACTCPTHHPKLPHLAASHVSDPHLSHGSGPQHRTVPCATLLQRTRCSLMWWPGL